MPPLSKFLTQVQTLYSPKFPIQEIGLDGEIKRLDCDKRGDGKIWAVGNQWEYKGNTYSKITFGNWACGDSHVLKSWDDDENLAKDKNFQKNVKKKNEEVKVRLDLETQKKHQSCRDKWAPIFEKAEQTDKVHPYLVGKQISSNFSARIDSYGNLLIPVYNFEGFAGLQRIVKDQEKSFEEDREVYYKAFTKGIKIKGGFCPLSDDWKTASLVYVAEGFSTAASIQMATDTPAICLFNANNILPGIQRVRHFNPNCRIVICADRDHKPGKREHKIGERKAKYAASKFSNCIVRVAPFSDSNPSNWSDFNDLHCFVSLDEVRLSLAIKASDFVDIIKLGFLDKKFYYFNTQTLKLDALTANEHNKNHFLAMANHKFWGDNYCYKKDKEGNPTTFADFDIVTERIMEEQREKGFFSYQNIRGYGTNRDKDKLVVNTGDRLYRDGKCESIFSPGFNTKYFYQANRPYGVDFSQEANGHMGKRVIEAFKMLNYKNKNDYVYLAGWIACAQIFGGLDWRPHLWLTGVKGSGKTTILKWVHDLLPFSISVRDSTQAGIKQTIKNNSMAVIYDEAEPNDEVGKKRMAGIIELARQCSSLTDSRVLRGTVSGEAIEYRTNSIFLLGSIQKSLPTSADTSRFFPVELLSSKNQRPEDFRKLKYEMENVAEFSVPLFVRMVNRFPMIQESILMAREALRGFGNEARQADQLAAIMVGYYYLFNDQKMTIDHVEGIYDLINYDQSEYREANEYEESDLCLEAVLDLILPGKSLSIAQAIEEAKTKINVWYERELESVGIKYLKSKRELFISSNHLQLKKLLKETIYTDWAAVLKRHRDFVSYGNCRIAGKVRKGVFLKWEE